ncbi:cupin domain-containing protein [soil metagenome]
MTPDEIISLLDLEPHPEVVHYAETWRGADDHDGRAEGTAIYYLLRAGERSQWHRVDATEIWMFHAGGPLNLDMVAGDSPVERSVLGPDIAGGERPQLVVPAGAWQSAIPLGSWTLVSCTVTPGFTFDGFELAPQGWTPGSPVR